MKQWAEAEQRDRLRFAHGLLDHTDAIALRAFRGGLAVRAKSDGTLVTQADTEIERLIRERVADAYPADGFLGEELGLDQPSAEARWILDPIDATHNFVRGIGVFATLLAFERASTLELGVVSAPAPGRVGSPRVAPARFSARAALSGVSASLASVAWLRRTRWAKSTGRRNTSRWRWSTMGVRERQRAVRAMRGQMWSPGRPSTARREDRIRFWQAIGRGASTDGAATLAGVSSGRRGALVPSGWRDAAHQPGPGLGALPVVHRARGDRDPARPGRRGAPHRPAPGSCIVDDQP